MKMKHSLRQLDELDSRICMRHIMKHNWCLKLCLVKIRKSNFFIMLPHCVLHVNPRVQLFPHREDFEAQCEATEIRDSNPKISWATKKSPHGTPLNPSQCWGVSGSKLDISYCPPRICKVRERGHISGEIGTITSRSLAENEPRLVQSRGVNMQIARMGPFHKIATVTVRQ